MPYFLSLIVLLLFSSNALADSSTKECFKQLGNNPHYQYLASKIVLGPDAVAPIATMLEIKDKPTKEEQILLLEWDQQRNRCIGLGANLRKKYSKELSHAMDEGFNMQEKLFIELAIGNLTYGEYAKLRFAIKTRTMATVKQFKERMNFF